MLDQLMNFEHATGFKEMLTLIGLGNHGGGPNLPMLERAQMLREQPLFPNVAFIRPQEYIELLMKKDLSVLPEWSSEMYLENHRGTFTSQASIKRHNRINESLLETAEKAATIAHWHGLEYPATELEKAWKAVLLNQFHDILPGSSITPVYRDANETSAEVHERVERILGRSLRAIAMQTEPPANGRQVYVFNPLSWERDGWVTIGLSHEDPANLTVKDSRGEVAPSRIVESDNGLHRELVFRARNIPSLGTRLYSLHAQEPSRPRGELAQRNTLENEYLRVTVNPRTGNISSIYDKANHREALERGREGNVIELHENLPDFWDAWNIGYTGRSWTVDEVDAIELVEDNEVRSVLRVKKSFLGLTKANRAPTEGFPSSFFVQDIVLYRDSPRIDVHMTIDWWEDHTLLKIAFPFAVEPEMATYEIPYGSIERSTRRETVWERARFEVPVHRWADLSANGYGVSLLNDSKYGMDIHDNVMRLTLLTSPLWPDPMADRGKNKVVYSVYPHAGDWKEADTVRRATELNLPLIGVVVEDGHGFSGAEPGIMSFVTVDKKNAVLTAMKKAESSDASIVRVVETEGLSGRVVLEMPAKVESAVEVDLLENDIGEVETNGHRVLFPLSPFEIKSLRITLER
jgi:alpha-mannosidase